MVIEHLLDLLMQVPGEFAFAVVIIVLLLCGLGLPMPEEIPLVAAGYLAHHGVIGIRTAILSCTIAIVTGDVALFLIGEKLGSRIFELAFFKRVLHPERMKTVNAYFHRYGSRVVFVARFMAGVRAAVFIVAGILRMPLRRFVLLDGVAALISVPLLVYLAYYFGDEIDEAIFAMRRASGTMLAIALCIVMILTVVTIVLKRRRAAKPEEL